MSEVGSRDGTEKRLCPVCSVASPDQHYAYLNIDADDADYKEDADEGK